ncbi:hypothetical protein [Aeromonas jandaei]|uniref:hypothetical protein n=1 Tax=Aeromonas jandaei TaxID=650 RepID=UPI001C04478E|nr:hypothetical protein [Aeromonas jandaei]QWL67556.1 hypothetical protein HQ398_16280 [Aeromonas jandaei]
MRDPRKNPVPGDILFRLGVTREVTETPKNGRGEVTHVVFAAPPGCMKFMTEIENWREWSEQGAVVVRVGGDIRRISIEITAWQEAQLSTGQVIEVPARAEVTIEEFAASDKPSRMHIELLANALVKQAQELRECGPEEWESVIDMVEGALNNIRFDMMGDACTTN